MLLAYAKLALHDELLDSPVPDDPYLGKRARALFPDGDARALPGRDRQPPAAARDHRDAARQRHRQSRRPDDRHRASSTRPAPTRRRSRRPMRRPATRFGLIDLNAAIDALDGMVPGALQLRLYGDLQDLLMSRIVWFIRNVDFTGESLDAVVGTYRRRHRRGRARPAADALARGARGAWDARARRRSSTRACRPISRRRLAALPDLVAAPDIVLVGAAHRPAGRRYRARRISPSRRCSSLGALIGAARGDRGQRLLRPPRARPGDRRHRRRAPQPHGGGGRAPAPPGAEAVDGLERASAARTSRASAPRSTASLASGP